MTHYIAVINLQSCKTSVNNSFTIEINVHHPKSFKNISTEAEFSRLHSAKSTRRLEQIAGLRVCRIRDHVDLPQLVLCSDQSAGKSSVLEGITGLPLPQQDGVCTKFATKIILQHSDCERVIVATVLPTASRPEQSKLKLHYRRQLAEFDKLPIAIAEVGSLMGIILDYDVYSMIIM